MMKERIYEVPIEETPFGRNDEARHMVGVLSRILAERERELLELKGPCSNKTCRLHYAHAGPCDTRSARA